MISSKVEAQGLLNKLRKLEGDALQPIRQIVKDNAEAMKDEIRTLVGKSSKGRSSRPGQPPRKLTGRLQGSVKIKAGKASKRFAEPGLSLYVTVDADDGRGNRYPFMLESGTKTADRRPFIKRAQRKIKKKFVRELIQAVKQVTRD